MQEPPPVFYVLVAVPIVLSLYVAYQSPKPLPVLARILAMFVIAYVIYDRLYAQALAPWVLCTMLAVTGAASIWLIFHKEQP